MIEHPGLAGGHLETAKVAALRDSRFGFDVVISQELEFFKTAEIEREIALIAAGGINCREVILRLQALSASAVQLRTFAVSHEGDAHPSFKKVLVDARPEDMVGFIRVAG